jgi:exo-1,4-beta-D-glucosaminidase
MLDDLCTSNCELKVQPSADGDYEVTVSNPTDKVALMIRLTAKDSKGQLICPTYWSDNYLTLAPGETRIITCKMPSLSAKDKISITISE